MIKTKESVELKKFKTKIRTAVADYMSSEGCGCCRDDDNHKIHTAVLGSLLDVPLYKDGSGWNFPKFRSKNEN